MRARAYRPVCYTSCANVQHNNAEKTFPEGLVTFTDLLIGRIKLSLLCRYSVQGNSRFSSLSCLMLLFHQKLSNREHDALPESY